MHKILFGLLFIGFSSFTQAQNILQIKVLDETTKLPISSVSLTINGKGKGVSDSVGFVQLSLANGEHKIAFSRVGYKDVSSSFVLPDTAMHAIEMTPIQKQLEDVTVVSSTRNNQRIENSPLKVEVLGREEMDEENTIKPANIASILGDISGVQIQQSSAISGNANVRIQGLDGRYTQILRDGLPLFDGFSGGFGVLSIPPLDLKQVELIKGSASTLYGGGAIGGLVNIISRKPTMEQNTTFTLNASTLKEANVNAYLAKRNKYFGYTFFGGYTNQKEVDVNGDGFSDVAKMDALVFHPKLFYYPNAQTTLSLGYTFTTEKRIGGDMLAIENQTNAQHPFFEENKTDRHSVEFVIERNLGGKQKLEFKSSISSFDRNIRTNIHSFKGNQFNYFTELSYFAPYGEGNSVVVGVNVSGDRFKVLPADLVAIQNFDNSTIGLFAQNTWQLNEKTIFEAGLRTDYHPQYGGFFLPRLALMHRFNEHWGSRFGIGFGYKTPNALSAQNVDYSIQKIQSLPSFIRAENSFGLNAEFNYKMHWEENEIFINQAFFLTQIDNPVIANENANGEINFSNAPKPIITKGFDTYIKATIDEWELYVGYTYTIAERTYLAQNQFVPLIPKHRMAFTIVKDIEGLWRFGLEGSYNGVQFREDASETKDYFFMAALVERKFGEKISLVLNGENLLDFRQSNSEQLYTGSITNPQFKSLWAPIDGRVINLALRLKL
jgi:outer membrane receptor for ferrienterochelin and colicins